MTWEHITPIHANDIGADMDCSDTQYPAKFAAVADFDGDGRAEVLVAPGAGGSRGNDLWVMKFDEGSGSWEHMAPLADEMQADIDCSDSQYPAKFAVVADFDGDGRAEVLVAPDANDSRGNDLWVMKYVGTYPDGSFQHMAQIPNQQDPKMEADIDCSDTKYPAKFAVVADFDADGRAEVLVAPDADVSRGNDLWVMKYVGTYPDGSFQHMAQLDDEMQADIDCSDTPYPAKFAVVADFDADGRAEVLVAPDADDSRGNDLWVMKYVGTYPDGSFQHMAQLDDEMQADIDCSDTPYPAKFAVVADFDGDGRAEVLVAPDADDSRGNDLWVMKYVGTYPDGSFQHMAQLDDEMQADIDCSDTPYPAKFAVVADFDGDGRPEVLVAPDADDSRGNDLWVMKYVGTYPDGSFQHMAQLDDEMQADIDCSDTPYPAKFAVVADFDADGRPEVLVAPDADDSRGNDLWVMKYVGTYPDGSFQHMAQLDDEMQADIDCSGTDYPAKFAAVADFDADGRPEVMVAPGRRRLARQRPLGAWLHQSRGCRGCEHDPQYPQRRDQPGQRAEHRGQPGQTGPNGRLGVHAKSRGRSTTIDFGSNLRLPRRWRDLVAQSHPAQRSQYERNRRRHAALRLHHQQPLRRNP